VKRKIRKHMRVQNPRKQLKAKNEDALFPGSELMWYIIQPEIIKAATLLKPVL
jgi:hypothetical protein